MDACGSKKPKKERTCKHEKHIPAYLANEARQSSEDIEKRRK
jgi:hypothetical protein